LCCTFRPTASGKQYDFRREAEAQRRRRTERENERDCRTVEEMSTRGLALITTNKKEPFLYNSDRYLDTTCSYDILILTKIFLKLNTDEIIYLLILGFFCRNRLLSK